MKHAHLPATVLLIAGLAAAPAADAQRSQGPPAEAPQGPGPHARPNPSNVLEVPTGPGIAWFGTWESGLAEAKRTGRPILLMSAAPQCHGVPGMW